jgi:polar amino acid transport system ATP-binding protein
MMDKGQLIESGAPDTIFQTPKEQRTRDFVGKILRH